MSFQIQIGAQETLALELPNPEQVLDLRMPAGEPLDDVVAAVVTAVETPQDFPALSSATVPGDKIALAVERDMPQSEAVVAGVIHALLAAGRSAADITVVLGCEERRANEGWSLQGLFDESILSQIAVESHNPDDEEELAFLATSKMGLGIYFNRTVCEADVVLPISSVRLADSAAYAGVSQGLFPLFSDRKTQGRFATAYRASEEHLLDVAREAEEAVWLLGVQFAIQVVPGEGDSIIHVLAGDSTSIAQEGQRLTESAWRHRVENRSNLVIALLDGEADQQTWDNAARAIHTASHLVEEGGAIVLCTSIDRIADGPLPLPEADDGAPQYAVYLLSQLGQDDVEEMGFAYLQDARELENLADSLGRCVILGSAHRAGVKVAGALA